MILKKNVDAISSNHYASRRIANRLKATIEGRLEWCLSRQRVWGVPIPAFICNNCDYTYISKEFIDEIANNVANKALNIGIL